MLKAKKSALVIHLMEDRLRLLAGQITWLGFDLADFQDLEADFRKDGGREDFRERLSREIERFVLQNNLKGPQVVMALSRKLLIWRSFRVPPVPADNLNNLVEFEVEKHLPLQKEEFRYRYRPLERDDEGWNILLVAAKKDFTRGVEGALEMMGLNVSAILPDIWGFVYLQKNQGNELKSGYPAVASVSPDSLDLAVFKDGVPVFYRQYPLPEMGEGDQAASPSGESPPPAEAVGGLLKKSIEEAHGELFIEGQMETAFLYGNGLDEDRLTELVDRELVRNWSAVKTEDLSFLKGRSDLERHQRLAATVGLALGVEDSRFCPLNMIEEDGARKQKGSGIKVTAALFIVFLAAASFYYGSQVYARQKRVEKLDATISELKDEVQKVRALEETLQKKEAQLRNLEKVVTRRTLAVDILRELTTSIPPSAYLNQIVLKKEALEISGYADSASELIPALEASPIFKNVAFAAPITSRGKEKERFKIKLTLE
jgi:general secretion pathway protein L